MLRVTLNESLKAAVKAKDQRATSTLRLILAALKDRDIAARGKGNCDGIGEDEILVMLQQMVRQREEAIQLYDRGGRNDLVQKENEEIDLIQRFLPEQLHEHEMQGAIQDVIGELRAVSLKDMGRIMGKLKERYPGRMDFGRASAIVKQKLS
jgi:uncharacterized protein